MKGLVRMVETSFPKIYRYSSLLQGIFLFLPGKFRLSFFFSIHIPYLHYIKKAANALL